MMCIKLGFVLYIILASVINKACGEDRKNLDSKGCLINSRQNGQQFLINQTCTRNVTRNNFSSIGQLAAIRVGGRQYRKLNNFGKKKKRRDRRYAQSSKAPSDKPRRLTRKEQQDGACEFASTGFYPLQWQSESYKNQLDKAGLWDVSDTEIMRKCNSTRALRPEPNDSYYYLFKEYLVDKYTYTEYNEEYNEPCCLPIEEVVLEESEELEEEQAVELPVSQHPTVLPYSRPVTDIPCYIACPEANILSVEAATEPSFERSQNQKTTAQHSNYAKIKVPHSIVYRVFPFIKLSSIPIKLPLILSVHYARFVIQEIVKQSKLLSEGDADQLKLLYPETMSRKLGHYE